MADKCPECGEALYVPNTSDCPNCIKEYDDYLEKTYDAEYYRIITEDKG